MIYSCQNMTLSTMIVLKLHEVCLYIFFGLISTIFLPVLFSSLFFPQMKVFFLLYTPLHSYLTLSVRQFALLFYAFLVIVSTIYFPVLLLFDFPYCGCNLFLPHLFIVTLFADDIFIYSYTSVLHI